MGDHSDVVETLERRAPALFLVAGLVMIVFGINTYLKTFVGTSYPIVQGVVAPSGFLVGVLGLLGLYPHSRTGRHGSPGSPPASR